MRVIAISDLHLGAPASLLAVSSVTEKLVDKLRELGDVTEFVLLGDVLDLTMAPSTDAWEKARTFFQILFSQVARNACIYYVPGNHDHHVWSMLVENQDIVLPLKDSVSNNSDRPNHAATLNPIQFVGSFGPESKTFVHALFPEIARGRLWIVYAFLPLPGSREEKPLLFHHGHYFDKTIAPLACRIAAKYHDEQKVEECNFAWLEGLFYCASIGRTTREFLKKAYMYYERTACFLRDAYRPSGQFREQMAILHEKRYARIGGVSVKQIRDLVFQLYEMQSYTLVFGHTHRIDEFHEKANTISIYNTGGWLVEKCSRSSDPIAYPAVFYAQGDECKCLSLDNVTRDEMNEAYEKAANISPIR